MNRLYVVEPALTVTGAMADHRLRAARRRRRRLRRRARARAGRRAVCAALAPLAALAHGQGQGHWDPKLADRRGRAISSATAGAALVIAGRRQPAGRARAGRRAQRRARQRRRDRRVRRARHRRRERRAAAPLGALAEEIAAGAVDTLVITARNPVYAAPVDFKLGAAPASASRTPSTTRSTRTRPRPPATRSSPRRTRSSPGATRAPSTARCRSCSRSSRRCGAAITEAELLAAFLGEGDARRARARAPLLAQAAVPRRHRPAVRGPARHGCRRVRRRPGSAGSPTASSRTPAPGARRGWPSTAARWPRRSRRCSARDRRPGLEIAFAVDPKVYDGRFANNAWLQELPHPITKLTWDNAALLSEATAEGLGRRDRRRRRDHLPRAQASRRRSMIVPGHADDAVTLPLGYGRAGAETRRRAASASTPARCAPATRPGSTAAPRSSKTGRRLQVRHHPGPLDDGARRPRDPAARRRRAARRGAATSGSKFHEELEERRGPLPTIHKPVDYSGQSLQVGHGDRPQQVHRLQRLRRRLPVGEQHPGRRQGATSPRAARCTGSASTATSRGAIDEPRGGHPAARLRALRDGALRVRLPGQRHRPQRRGPERDGLQPLHRHPLLQQQLPVQGPALQLPRLHRRDCTGGAPSWG